MKKTVIGICFIAAIWFVASPYVTVQQMKNAADNNDGEALSEFIEFPTLRQNFKDQMNASMAAEAAKEEDNPFAAMGVAFGAMMLDGMIDAFITPASIAEMMKGEDIEPGESNPNANQEQENTEAENDPFADASLSYKSWDKFVIQMPDESGEVVDFTLRRRGIGWKLTKITLPKGK